MSPEQLIRALGTTATLTGCGADHAELVARTRVDLGDVVDLLEERRRPSTRPADPVTESARSDRPGIAARREAVAELVAQGLRDPEIAERLGVRIDAVRSLRRRIGLAGQSTGVRTGWEDRVREAHAEGLPNSKIAERLGYTVRTVQQHLYTLGLKANKET